MNNREQKKGKYWAHFILLFLLFAPLTYAANATQTQNTTEKTEALEETAAVDATTAFDATSSVDTTVPDSTEVPTTVRDPLEKLNRAIFSFNDTVDKAILKPVATFYNTIVPKPLNQGIHNFFNNIGTVTTIVNDALQLNFYQMTNDLWRLGINTTIGIGGLFDVASRMGLPYYSNDFGLTLAAWGWKNSSYFVIPFWGPSTLRDVIQHPVDYFYFSVYPYIEPTSTRYELYALGVVDRRAQLLQFQSVLDEAAIDKYVFVRNAYIQRRAYQIEENKHRGYHGQNVMMQEKAT